MIIEQLMLESVRNWQRELGSVHEGSVRISSKEVEDLDCFSYHLLFKPTDHQSITIQYRQHQQFDISIPICQESTEDILACPYSLFLILFAKSVTIGRQSRLKNALTLILSEWEIECEWKKGQNYYKAILQGACSITHLDMTSFEQLLLHSENVLNLKSISQLKLQNAYLFCRHYFQSTMMPKLMNNQNVSIEIQYEQSVQELQQIYQALICQDRVQRGRKGSRQCSWAKLEKEINQKIVKSSNMDSHQSSIAQAIEQAVQNILQEQYSNELEKWPQDTLTSQFYQNVLNSVTKAMGFDRKTLALISSFTNRLFEDFQMRGPSVRRKTAQKTQYAYNQKISGIMKKVQLIQKQHVLEKQNLFKLMKEKQQELEQLRVKYQELSDRNNEQLLTLRKGEEQDKKQLLYLERKIEQIKKKTLFEIQQNAEDSAKEISPKNRPTLPTKPNVGMHKKSLSQKHIIRPHSITRQIPKPNFVQKNKKIPKSLNTTKLNTSKENLLTQPKGRKTASTRKGQKEQLKTSCR